MDQIERHEQLIESYLRGLMEHRGAPEEYLRELQREREELERERELDPRPEANKEEQERVLDDIEEIPQPRDRTRRSLLSAAEKLGSGHMAKDG